MYNKVEYLSCGEVEALRFFQIPDMRYNDRNVLTEKARKTVLQLYLI